MPNIKELYVSDSLNGLHDLGTPFIAAGTNMDQLGERIKNALYLANKNVEEGDEEMAYCYFLEMFAYIKHIETSPELAEYRDFLNLLVDPEEEREPSRLLLIQLRLSLHRRYNAKRGITTRSTGTQTEPITFRCSTCNTLNRFTYV